MVKKTQLQMIAEGLDVALDPCQPLQQKQSCMSIRLEFLKAFCKPYQTKNSDANVTKDLCLRLVPFASDVQMVLMIAADDDKHFTSVFHIYQKTFSHQPLDAHVHTCVRIECIHRFFSSCFIHKRKRLLMHTHTHANTT